MVFAAETVGDLVSLRLHGHPSLSRLPDPQSPTDAAHLSETQTFITLLVY